MKPFRHFFMPTIGSRVRKMNTTKTGTVCRFELLRFDMGFENFVVIKYDDYSGDEIYSRYLDLGAILPKRLQFLYPFLDGEMTFKELHEIQKNKLANWFTYKFFSEKYERNLAILLIISIVLLIITLFLRK